MYTWLFTVSQLVDGGRSFLVSHVISCLLFLSERDRRKESSSFFCPRTLKRDRERGRSVPFSRELFLGAPPFLLFSLGSFCSVQIGVFQLMSNAPPSDFKATFTSSFSLFISSIHIRQGVACIVSRVGDKVYLPIEDISLVLTARDLIEEDLFRSFSSSSSSYTSSFFSSSGSRGAPPPIRKNGGERPR